MDREELRDAIDAALDIPLSIVAFVSLILIIIDLSTDLSPGAQRTVDIIYWLTWGVFVIEYVVKLLLSIDKSKYIRGHWVELAIIILPFLRILRVLRVVRLTRSIALLRFFLYSRFGTAPMIWPAT